MEDIVFESATEIVKKIKNKKITVVETVTSFLNQIEKYKPKINAVVDLREKEEILEEARAKDLAIENGLELGLLHGLPLTIKDRFLVKGLKNSNGDPFLRNYIATEDAELVKRLKDVGAIIIGKTNTALYCIDWQSTNFWNGQTNNPYDISRVAGGSSGGSAASVASGFSPLVLGADAGGSIRVPAHFNGTCGLRPSENFLSNRGHLKVENKPQGRRHIITPGPLAKNVTDLILMMEVLGNNTKYELPELPPIKLNDSKWNKMSLNIAYSESINDTDVDAEYIELFRDFINKIKKENHSLRVDHPKYDEQKAYVECSKIIGFEIGINNPKVPLLASFMFAFIGIKYKDYLWAKGMALGQRLSNINYAKAIDYKDQFSEIYNSFLTIYDIWITPVCSFEAYKHQSAGRPFLVNNKKVDYTKAIASFTFTTAFSGHPIVVIPIAKKKNGMPVGIQIHSKKWTDKKLLEIAHHFEKFTDGFEKPEL
ncbi:amidase [Frigoriflavimonas asaccharolytica]|uniref:Amidase n=1 Tax=Frigoriflavimonas asaccharolytica TaxID=2735899 RepID=A0A8J8K587_9FLAO|nr:amidase family protein [Frigoriflavimonas asaccharolytica]NRS92550.1 amidase [Frigoriflavimonas asaccharolytica]